MPSLDWNAEGGAENVTITTANSGGASGDAFDGVSTDVGITIMYDPLLPAVGKSSAKIAVGSTTGRSYFLWQGKIASRWPAGMTTNYGRTYLKLDAYPPSDRTFVIFYDPTNITQRGSLRVRATGAIRVLNAALTGIHNTTTTMSLNTWYRIEWQMDGSTTGAWTLAIFLGNSATPLETTSGTSNFGGVIGVLRIGVTSTALSTETEWLDSINVNDVGLPGPATYASRCPGRWRGTWVGSGDTPAFRQTDDFTDNSVNTSLWTQFAFGSVTGSETGGTYTFAVANTGTGGAQLLSQVKHSITGDVWAAELVNAGVQTAGLQAYAVEFQVDANNRVFITVANGFIGAYQTVASVTTDHGFTAYNPAVHRWFQLREAAGTTYWEVSANGVFWTTLASAANPIATSDVTLLIGADTYLTLASSKTVVFGAVSAPALT